MNTRTLSDREKVSWSKRDGRKVDCDEQILDKEYTEEVHKQAACEWNPY